MLVKITSADGSAEERSYDISGRLIRKTARVKCMHMTRQET